MSRGFGLNKYALRRRSRSHETSSESFGQEVHEGQTKGVVWPPRHKIIVEGDPCGIDDEKKPSSIRFVIEDVPEASSSSQRPTPQHAEGASSSSSEHMDRAEQVKELANYLVYEEKLEEAVRCYSKAIEMNSSVPKYYRNRGLCLSRLDQVDSAMHDYQIALDQDPESVRGLVYMSRALFEKGELQSAYDLTEKAYAYGVAQELIDQVLYQVTSLRDRIGLKLKEKQRERRVEVYHFFNDLMKNDYRGKIAKAPENEESLKADFDEYQKELKAAIPEAEEEQQTTGNEYDYLRDKIDWEFMTDPVITPSGITYEKNLILRHLEDNLDDPVSRQPLNREQLIPNKSLKEVLDDVKRKRGLTRD